jgi:integrase
MDELDPGVYRYANEENINHKIDSFLSEDRALVKEFININRAQKGIKLVRVTGILNGLKAWRVVINKPFRKWALDDIYEGVNFIRNKKNYKTSTAILYISLMKSFITWMITAKYSKIPLEEIIKIQLPKNDGNSFKSGDILTEEEVKIVLSCCVSERDRALIALLYDGGFRMIEAAMMTWADLDFQFPDRITAQTSQKTYVPRMVSLMSCKDLMSAWREHYPGEPTGNNPVFVTRDGVPFKYNTAYEVIKGIRRRAIKKGLDPKRIKLHQFRRASITHEVNKGRPISHICIERWGRAYSPMIEVYAKPSEQDVLKSKMDMLGIEPKRSYVKRKTAMQPVQCPDCGTVNGPTLKFCGTCGRSVTGEGLSKMERMKRDILENPDELIAFLQDLKKERDGKAS